ncbi:MAG TPA: SIMPL domain-containing protein [Actinomycetota bacterium]|jgi:hypothetical protein
MAEGGVVTIRGEARTRARADEVHVILEVSVLEQAVEAALQEAADRSHALDGIFIELGIPEEQRTTSGLLVAEEHDYERGRAVHLGYRARNQIAVRLTDPAIAGPLMRLATERAQVRIQGPWWSIRPDNPALLEACRQAAEQARRKADAYAAALSLRVGSVVSATEPGAGHDGFQPMSGHRYVEFAAAGAEEGPDLELQAGDVEVFGAIDVTFRLEHG